MGQHKDTCYDDEGRLAPCGGHFVDDPERGDYDGELEREPGDRGAVEHPEPTSLTPGPWTFDFDEHAHNYEITTGQPHGGFVEMVATVSLFTEYGGPKNPTQAEADARAIAEVPAMLALLRAMTAHADRHNTRDPQNISEARALLARVRGGEGR
jgi:hypothetical protein